MQDRTERLETVDALRGIAALSVCLFHFTNGRSSLAPAFGFGVRGIEIFFVISGFIIPYAMTSSGYTRAAWPKFILKRALRIDPPYLASIGVVLMIGLAGSIFQGKPQIWTMPQVASHIAFMTGIVGHEWLNAVYWTLGLELQFYLLMSVLFPVFARPRLPTIVAICAASLAFAALGPSRVWVTPYLPVFVAGLLAFWQQQGWMPMATYWMLLAITGSATGFLHEDASVGVAAIVTSAIITSVRMPRVSAIAFLGAISYPLYVLHVPISGKVLNLAARLQQSVAVEIFSIAAAIVATIIAAYLLHVTVERPAMRLASRIKYSPAARLPHHAPWPKYRPPK